MSSGRFGSGRSLFLRARPPLPPRLQPLPLDPSPENSGPRDVGGGSESAVVIITAYFIFGYLKCVYASLRTVRTDSNLRLILDAFRVD